ncbi:MFS transporter [Spongiactinospora sp. TRM90649]|uniref:MFS transporter n=1 Tax=Spongiactinospora sp. TRM90649 TaxID=3031114 RepID=UPI0023F80EE4|nr:MFS transporter [Spongiactinospora sp. TRM90649]MDF5752807.1 MFS transporter [Spongiactinospora sp. TRM90649]
MSFRLVRAAVFAVVCVGLSAAAHRVSGGTLSVAVVAGGLLLAFGAGAAASGRERSLAVILPLLAGTQVALHVLFSLSHAPVVQEVTGHTHASTLAPGMGMLIAHAWAAGMSAMWLAKGEAALWGVLRRLAVRLRPMLVPYLQPVDEPDVVVAAPEPGRLRSVLLASAAPRRGPPYTQVSLHSG